jgi:hypothetical protein
MELSGYQFQGHHAPLVLLLLKAFYLWCHVAISEKEILDYISSFCSLAIRTVAVIKAARPQIRAYFHENFENVFESIIL